VEHLRLFGGIGFTMALFVAMLAFGESPSGARSSAPRKQSGFRTNAVQLRPVTSKGIPSPPALLARPRQVNHPK
jgi:hypothetical protein